MFDALKSRGYSVYATNHAGAILEGDFPTAAREVEAALVPLAISPVDLIEGGGGEGKLTQRLRHDFNAQGWKKKNVHISTAVDGKEFVADSHEVDHVKTFPQGQLLLEIEWNNKDPFYDRDLMNFRSLHAANYASVGLIVTRGESLQDSLEGVVGRFLRASGIDSYDRLGAAGFTPGTVAQRKRHRLLVERAMDPYTSLAQVFVRDKYGAATTHWRKLMARIERGMGRPCPLVCIGIPANVLVEPSL